MENTTLEKLYTERRLIKELISLDKERYSYLLVRNAEIKIEINSNYQPKPMQELTFYMYDKKLADKITEVGMKQLRELLNTTDAIHNI